MGSLWTFVAWGMDVIRAIEPPALNGHHFILVAIDYFIKWVKTSTYKAVTKKVVVDFVRNNIVCQFGILESIITNNVANLNSDLMKEICEQIEISHQNSTAYRPWMNGVDEATNKNIKKIFKKDTGYRTTIKTSIGPTPYMLVYGSEAVVPAEVERPSLSIIQEVSLDDAERICRRIEQLMLNDEKRMDAVCHG
ncbi:uncharacterized protein LOC129875760 [Solanum dulcamara]|uniref:uncharacterized protein LOC129875760 n=1 Tax=Solanum dulcamara TaxID=45834 RepID=UPI00248575F5|nr:uncharacterized protein LOC129875760 [Solanum dulcamara]